MITNADNLPYFVSGFKKVKKILSYFSLTFNAMKYAFISSPDS